MFKKTTSFFTFILILLFGFLACNSIENSEWETHLPGGKTTCSGDSPYAFFTRQSESSNLLIFFQPGGACPDRVPCDPDNPKFFDPTVHIPYDDSTKGGFMWDQDHPALQKGIFDFDDKRNPFRDYNVLYIPYCTGDVHIGDNVLGEMNYKGYVNTSAVLEWAYSKFDELERIFVAGSSAGGIAAPFYVASVKEQYPDAKVVVLGDSSGGYRFSMTDMLKNWGSLSLMQNEFGITNIPTEKLNFDSATIVNGNRYPDITFAQFNTNKDSAQQEFELMSSGLTTPLAELLAKNHADIRAKIDNFRTYTVNAKYHMILQNNRFYKESVNGVLFYEWVTDLSKGVDVSDVAP